MSHTGIRDVLGVVGEAVIGAVVVCAAFVGEERVARPERPMARPAPTRVARSTQAIATWTTRLPGLGAPPESSVRPNLSRCARSWLIRRSSIRVFTCSVASTTCAVLLRSGPRTCARYHRLALSIKARAAEAAITAPSATAFAPAEAKLAPATRPVPITSQRSSAKTAPRSTSRRRTTDATPTARASQCATIAKKATVNKYAEK